MSRSTASNAADLNLRRRVADWWLSSTQWRRIRRPLAQTVVALAVLVVAALAAGAIYVATLPSVADAPARVERIVAAHGGTLGRLPVPRRLGDAMVAVEDEHFYDNFLVNVIDGAGRATLATLHAQRDPGGSTIEQQLAKLLYGRGTSWGATLREIGLGIRLSLNYSKPEILEMYLNAVYYGNGYWGYVAAARGYFGVSPQHLDWAQAAMLAGLLQAPSAYDPMRHYRVARKRQEHVLDQLAANHYLTTAQAEAVFRAPLGLR